MRLLLDSHVLFWWDTDLERLSASQREAIRNPHNLVFVSPITAWELGIKQAAGKLSLTTSIRTIAVRSGFYELAITAIHGEKAASLPLHHRDPFDRMLIAQSMIEEMTLVTADTKLAQYAGLSLLP